MAGDELTAGPVTGGMADGDVRRAVDAYLDELAARLTGRASARAAVLAEVRDGLLEAVERHRAGGLPPAAAAGAAVREFGEPATIAAAYRPVLAADLARHDALLVARSGPLVGLLWIGALVAGELPRAWVERGLPRLALLCLVVAVAVAMVNAALAVALTGRLSRWLRPSPGVAPTAAATTGLVCVVVDAAALILFAAWAVTDSHALAWTPLAAAASVGRAVLAGCAAHRCLAARSALAGS